VFLFQSQQACKHFGPKSTGQVAHVSQMSMIPFQQFGFNGSLSVHMIVQLLPIVQFLSQSSHFSVHSVFSFQHFWFGLTDLQSTQHNQSYQLLFSQLSHSSPGSTLPLPQDHVHFPTSHGQFLQFSAASIILFQQ
jgi:hypothetical protein